MFCYYKIFFNHVKLKVPRSGEEFQARFPRTKIASVSESRSRSASDQSRRSTVRARSRSGSSFSSLFSRNREIEKAVNIDGICDSLAPTSDFINVKCLSNLPLSSTCRNGYV